MSDFPSTIGKYLSTSPLDAMQKQVGDMKQSYLQKPFPGIQSPSPGPLGAPMPTSNLDAAKQSAPSFQQAAGVPSLQAVTPGFNAQSEGAGAQAQINATPPVPTFQPYTPAPYPTPQFESVPERGPIPAPPGLASGLAALAGAIAPQFAGQLAATPLQAAKGVADQQFNDAWKAYEAKQAQDDELNRFAQSGYAVNNAAGMANNAGVNNQKDLEYRRGLTLAALQGNVEAARTANTLWPGYLDSVIRGQQAAATGESMLRSGRAGSADTAATEDARRWAQQEHDKAAALDQELREHIGSIAAQRANLLTSQGMENFRASMSQAGENQRQGNQLGMERTLEQMREAAAQKMFQMKIAPDPEDILKRSRTDYTTLQGAIDKDPTVQAAKAELVNLGTRANGLRYGQAPNADELRQIENQRAVQQGMLRRLSNRKWNEAVDAMHLNPSNRLPLDTNGEVITGSNSFAAPVLGPSPGTPAAPNVAPTVRRYDPRTGTLH